jgi:hypothetical protein
MIVCGSATALCGKALPYRFASELIAARLSLAAMILITSASRKAAGFPHIRRQSRYFLP